jgi:hypothetical protein
MLVLPDHDLQPGKLTLDQQSRLTKNELRPLNSKVSAARSLFAL